MDGGVPGREVGAHSHGGVCGWSSISWVPAQAPLSLKEDYFGTQGIPTLTQQLEEVLRFQPGSSVPLSRLAPWARWSGQ